PVRPRGAPPSPYPTPFRSVADSHSPRDGRFIEKVGVYNPLLKKDDPQRVVLKVERIKEWLGKGAQPTDRVARELSLQGLVQWKQDRKSTRLNSSHVKISYA